MGIFANNLLKKAQELFIGGVNSPVRSLGYVGREPILIKRAKGSRVYDYDGRSYIDYVLSWGSLILGHARHDVIGDLKNAISSGLSFGMTTGAEVELAEIICDAIPFVKKIRFVNSGTEAVMGAIRLARAATGRDLIVKFDRSYHGHADYLLAKAGSGLSTLSIASSSGVPKDFIKYTRIAPRDDLDFIERLFKKDGKRIAAVLVEPVGGNYGVLPPDIDFLKALRSITKRYGALLVFDEVITGFRFGFGSFAQELNIEPDLICLGKIIGGGLPIGAYGGTARIMKNLAPEGRAYQGSTFSGNPVVMQAGISTISELKKMKAGYKRIKTMAEALVYSIKSVSEAKGIDMEAAVYGSMFSFKFKNKDDFVAFYCRMLQEGIFFAPSEFEANFVSFAHTWKDLDKTIVSAKKVLGDLRKGI